MFRRVLNRYIHVHCVVYFLEFIYKVTSVVLLVTVLSFFHYSGTSSKEKIKVPFKAHECVHTTYHLT